MSLNNLVKRLQDIMRNDAGINGDAQRIEQMVWILFLKVYDAKEEIWEFYDEKYTSIIPEELRWRNWAVDHKDGKALTGDALLNFVNVKLFPTLKSIEINENTPMSQIIVRAAFEDNNNYMKDGILLRQVINAIDEINFEEYEDRHAFGEIYETILRSLQSAGNSGEFYTPRAVTDFMVQMIKPKLGESIADFACGTGGFLTSALKVLDTQVHGVEDRKVYSGSVYGIEKKALPFLLCATNMLLHDIDNPRIVHGNSLEKNVRDYKDGDRFDVVLMNPPYGGNEKEGVKQNFPADLRSSETADLFMSVIMYRLKRDGRCAIILPDGFLFGTDNAKVAIKQKLLSEFNLHTVIRMPHSVFAPYTSITTNIEDQADGTTKQKELATVTIKAYLTPIPPLEEQRRILAKLSEVLPIVQNYGEIYGESVTMQDAFPARLKKSILQQAVQGKLVPQDPSDESAEVLLKRIQAEKQRLVREGKIKKDKHESVIFRRDNSHYEIVDGVERCIDEELLFEIPEGWYWTRLMDVCEYIQRGKSPKYSTIKKYPVIAQKCNQWSGFSIEKAQFIEPDSLASYGSERILQDNDLMWNSTGLGTLGRMAIYKATANPYGLAVADSHVTVIRPFKQFVLPEYLYFYFSNPTVQSVIEEQADGTTKQKELATATIKAYWTPIPPLNEQYRIVAKIKELLPLIQSI